jgi:hypothetical protein
VIYSLRTAIPDAQIVCSLGASEKVVEASLGDL